MKETPRREQPIELGQVFEQSHQNAQQLAEFKRDTNERSDRLQSSIEQLANRFQSSIDQLAVRIGSFAERRTDWMGMAAWATVVLAIIGMVATPIGYFALREADRKDKLVDALDIKLQREFQLSLETAAHDSAHTDDNSKERHAAALDQIAAVAGRVYVLEQWQTDRIKSDLEELRIRRLKESK